MLRFRMPVVAAGVVAVALVASAGAATPKKLSGTVGPGFTITLKQGTKAVKTLKAGTYSIKVSDKSNIHNFHLRGPGVNKEITSVGFVGTKTVVSEAQEGPLHVHL